MRLTMLLTLPSPPSRVLSMFDHPDRLAQHSDPYIPRPLPSNLSRTVTTLSHQTTSAHSPSPSPPSTPTSLDGDDDSTTNYSDPPALYASQRTATITATARLISPTPSRLHFQGCVYKLSNLSRWPLPTFGSIKMITDPTMPDNVLEAHIGHQWHYNFRRYAVYQATMKDDTGIVLLLVRKRTSLGGAVPVVKKLCRFLLCLH
jgi:hypothetical protein